MSNVKFEIQGLEQLQSKLERLSNPKKVKSIVRKSLRQAANIVRDAARNNAKLIDDPETAEKIWKNISVQAGKTRNTSEVKMRIGVRGGASFSNPNPPNLSGGDTRHWRWIEFGSVHNPAVPFMRPALINNIQPVTDKFARMMSDEINKAVASGS
ncbi:HK97 gp10 family phage protein [Acinetobacter bereziniae]|uniref:HK97-gp10 family putative phage morphogenesis protein n=1 Tax=Acinetobacter bereziniae TaxID=106648 RepID=UPI0019004D1F|nr:HK97-gp10 family putative phage morphogenesis protein [Acinetobacter bereziniae]MBJ8450333.1 HK97 gp10 family phage protein [Acinetobacter bereziniae]MBJ8454632.1 HK97 gp10 family phage protein [Acinetobacter bereziniae]